MSTTYRQPCGCKHDGTRWTELCVPHQLDLRDTHERWAADHRNAQAKAAAEQVKVPA